VQRGTIQSRDLRDLVYWNRAGENGALDKDAALFVVAISSLA
jgi:hypothetical protein